MRKHGIHINIYISESNHNETTNHYKRSDNGVQESRLRLWAFVSVGEAFLFLFEALKVHHESEKKVTI